MTTHRSAFVASCVGLLVFGVALSIVGAILPVVIDRFGLDTAQAGALPLLLSVGILVSSLLFGPAVDRWGYGALLAACGVVLVVGLATLAAGASFDSLRAGVLLLGLGGGALSGGTSALAAEVSDGRRQAALALQGACFGLGAVAFPLVLGVLVERTTHQQVLGGFAAAVIVALALLRVVRFPPPRHASGLPVRQMLRLFRDPVLLLYGAIIFFQSGLELTVGSWAATFLETELGRGTRLGLFVLAFYWLGMTLVRLLWGTALVRVPVATTIHLSLATALVGAALLLGTRHPASVWSGVFLLGAGFGGVFPTILALVSERYAALAGSAFSIVLVFGRSGGLVFPYVTGVLGAAFGLRAALLIIPVKLCVLALVFAQVRRRTGAAPVPSQLATCAAER